MRGSCRNAIDYEYDNSFDSFWNLDEKTVTGCGPESTRHHKFFSKTMDSARHAYIRSVVDALPQDGLHILLSNLADPYHSDWADTLHPNMWGSHLHGRCVRCGIRGGDTHIVGSWECNLIRSSERYFGMHIHLNVLN